MSTNTRRFTTEQGIALAAVAGLVMWAGMIATLMWAVSL